MKDKVRAEKMGMTTRILAVWGVIVTAVLIVIGIYNLMNSEWAPGASVKYYTPADLTTMGLPAWHLTNAVPLSPDQAIGSACRYATKQHPGVSNWDVDRIELVRETDDIWTYHAFLVDRGTGRYETEDIRILMNGNVWEPKSGRP
jgi:hypothetical protein